MYLIHNSCWLSENNSECSEEWRWKQRPAINISPLLSQKWKLSKTIKKHSKSPCSYSQCWCLLSSHRPSVPVAARASDVAAGAEKGHSAPCTHSCCSSPAFWGPEDDTLQWYKVLVSFFWMCYILCTWQWHCAGHTVTLNSEKDAWREGN